MLKKGRVSNDSDSLVGFLDDLGAEPMRVCLKSTTNSRPIVRFLEVYGRKARIDLTAEVLDARRLWIVAESTRSNGYVERQFLAQQGR